MATAASRTPALDRASAATVPDHRAPLARPAIGSWTLRIATATALGIDAVVHWQNAPAYDAVTATVSQGQLFWVEAAVVVLAGLGLLTHRTHPPRAPLPAAAATEKKRG